MLNARLDSLIARGNNLGAIGKNGSRTLFLPQVLTILIDVMDSYKRQDLND
jgi:hypothetical protein